MGGCCAERRRCASVGQDCGPQPAHHTTASNDNELRSLQGSGAAAAGGVKRVRVTLGREWPSWPAVRSDRASVPQMRGDRHTSITWQHLQAGSGGGAECCPPLAAGEATAVGSLPRPRCLQALPSVMPRTRSRSLSGAQATAQCGASSLRRWPAACAAQHTAHVQKHACRGGPAPWCCCHRCR